jgi:hypothetical protein
MASAIAFIHWENYTGGLDGRGLFASDHLTYNSFQERLHSLNSGDQLWLVSRCADDHQYFLVACLSISKIHRNPPGSMAERKFGCFGVVADATRSHDLDKRFPAEGLLRSLQFETNTPIKFGASLGQSMQSIRFLTVADERILDAALQRVLGGEDPVLDAPFGLWTKCESVFADYFLRNWQSRGEPLAFLLYDSPPVLSAGAPVFIHSDKNLRLLASFRESQFVAGHKYTVDAAERLAERERIWLAYRARTLDPPTKADFDTFWERQNGVRALFIMDNLHPVPRSCPFKTYGRALEWGYPIGVGYRYLSLSQCVLLLRHAQVSSELNELYLNPLLRNQRGTLS